MHFWLSWKTLWNCLLSVRYLALSHSVFSIFLALFLISHTIVYLLSAIHNATNPQRAPGSHSVPFVHIIVATFLASNSIFLFNENRLYKYFTHQKLQTIFGSKKSPQQSVSQSDSQPACQSVSWLDIHRPFLGNVSGHISVFPLLFDLELDFIDFCGSSISPELCLHSSLWVYLIESNYSKVKALTD